MSLLITNQVVMDPNDTVIEPAGWRVAVASETQAEVCLALPLHFGAERDAERAKAALEQAGLVSEGVLRLAGEGAVIRIMGEALAW